MPPGKRWAASDRATNKALFIDLLIPRLHADKRRGKAGWTFWKLLCDIMVDQNLSEIEAIIIDGRFRNAEEKWCTTLNKNVLPQPSVKSTCTF